jgi:Ca-activated chloride channel homolog
MMSKRFFIGFTVFSFFIGFIWLTGFSQNPGSGVLTGRVVDNQGQLLKDVNVTVRDMARNQIFQEVTDAKGHYVFKKLPEGKYVLEARLSGFSLVRIKGIEIKSGQTVTMNVILKLSTVNEEIEMEAADAQKIIVGIEGGVVGGVLGGVVGEAATPVTEGVPTASRTKMMPGTPPYYQQQPFNTEEYGRIYENQYLLALSNPLSTFSIDVDTASYANIRRFIMNNQLPPKDAVRIEEMINYFDYDYLDADKKHPFSLYTEISACPWNKDHRLIHIGLQGKKINTNDLPPSNLVFLLDVSGSMSSPNKLPLLKSAFKLLVKQLTDKDRISIVVYAGAAGLVLEPTVGNDKEKIIASIERLQARGSTAGGQGIQLAYKVAEENFIEKGNNRVILATDGDFNIGVSSTSELVRMIEEKREKGIFLTTLGFGMGNYKDDRMEQLADKGNGNYYYIDSLLEAKKVFISEMGGTLFTIAKDVKIQVEFNPAKVKAYRLIGYENRMLKKEDFDDDTKDAGELGAGHTVTAMYEIIPYGSEEEIPGIEKLKYQETKISPEAFKTKELMTIKLRYKQPDEDESRLIVHPLVDKNVDLKKTSDNYKFSAAVVEFGMLLRDSEYKGNSSVENILGLAKESKGKDENGYRAEFIKLVEMYGLMQASK